MESLFYKVKIGVKEKGIFIGSKGVMRNMKNVILKQDMYKQKEASLTVEASLVLPVFVFSVLFFLYFFQFLYLQDSVQSAMTEAGKFLSRYEKAGEESEVSWGMKQLLLKQRFYQRNILRGNH